MTYEDLIFNRQERETDDCTTFPFKGTKCKCQCEQIHENRRLEDVYPFLFR